jgi:hypothetical protein
MKENRKKDTRTQRHKTNDKKLIAEGSFDNVSQMVYTYIIRNYLREGGVSYG